MVLESNDCSASVSSCYLVINKIQSLTSCKRLFNLKGNMGRKKGSLNKKVSTVQLDFEGKQFEEITEVCMTTEKSEELEVIQQEIDQARIELEKTRFEIEAKKQELKTMPVVAKASETPSITIKDNSLSEKIAAQKLLDNEMVTGKFHNLRAKGQPAKLTYMHHADDPVKWYTFQHGEVYTIPRGFANEINEHYHTPRFIKNEGIILDPSHPESGIHSVDTSDKMYSFTPINF